MSTRVKGPAEGTSEREWRLKGKYEPPAPLDADRSPGVTNIVGPGEKPKP